jgi:trigger factor
MQVEVSRVDDATARLDVSLTVEEVNSAINSTYHRLSQRVKIPGFRPGKAPRALILRTYGEEDFYHQATDQLIRTWYPKALTESGVNALDTGELDSDEHAHVIPDTPFTFTAKVPTMPDVSLPDYGEIKIPAPSTSVTDDDIDKVIGEVRLSRATLESVAAKAAEVGDVVKMKIHGKAGGEDVVDRDDFDFELVGEDRSEAEQPFPGLSKEMVGARPGDIREITLALPDAYSDSNLAGKSLMLNIVVKEIQRKVLPELTDEFVKEISSSQTVDDLRSVIRHNIEHEKNEEAINAVAKDVVDSLIARTNPPAPEVLVAEEQDRMVREQRRYFERSDLRFDQFLLAARKSEEEYREDLRPAAERAVKRDLLLDAVAKAENLEPDAEAIDIEVKRMSGAVSQSEADYERLAESRRLHDVVAGDMRRRSALMKLVELASGLQPLVHDNETHEHVHDGEQGEVEETEPAEAVAGS